MNNQEFEFYKPIRNFIRRHSKQTLLKEVVKISYNISTIYEDNKKLEYLNQGGPPPHYLLLLGQWIIWDWNNIKGNKSITQNELNEIINKIISFDDQTLKYSIPEGSNLPSKLMRRLAFQQLWYQSKNRDEDVGRAIELLIKPPISQATKKGMYNYCGLERREFFDLLLVSIETFIHHRKEYITKDYYSTMKIDTKKIDSFFKILSISETDFSEFSKNFSTSKGVEIYERSFFRLKPFLNIDGKYYLWSIALLDEFIRFGIYDILKRSAKNDFSNCWGTIFENYLKERLNKYDISYTPEKQLKEEGYIKQVDFLIKHEIYPKKDLFYKISKFNSFKETILNCVTALKNVFKATTLKYNLILIEAKGIEASLHTMTYPSDKIMANTYKKSIVKALAQAHDVIAMLKKNNYVNDIFLLVVTYKELYLGDSEDAWNEFIKDSLERKYSIKNFNIKPKNIFFISVSDFDQLIRATDGNIEQIIKTFKKIIEQRNNVETKKYTFSLYLKELYPGMPKDTHLVKSFNNYIKNMQERYS